MIGIVVTDKPADKADDDYGRHGWGKRRSDGLCLAGQDKRKTTAASISEIQIERPSGQISWVRSYAMSV